MEKDITILKSLIEDLKREEKLIGYNAEIEIQAIESLIKGYKEKEEKLKKAYIEANNILYFDDSSDYCYALWKILRIINPDLEDYPNLEYIELEDK